MRRITSWRAMPVIAACVAVTLAVFIAPAPQPSFGAASAQIGTVTPTPTRRPGSVARLLLRGLSTKSPDGAGSGIKAQVLLPPEGPWSGQGFEFQKIEGPALYVEFIIYKLEPTAPNGRIEVYRHIKRNAPWCPFGEANGVCNSLAIVNRRPVWPDSVDAPGSGKPIEAGDYVMEMIAIGDRDAGNNISWRKRVADDNAIYFTIDLTYELPLPRLTGRAAITRPANGGVFSGIVEVRGTATSNNFAYYKFELLDPRCEKGVCFLQDFRRPIVNGLLWRWDTHKPLPNGVVLPNGPWTMQLVVVDKWERALPNPPTLTFTLNN